MEYKLKKTETITAYKVTDVRIGSTANGDFLHYIVEVDYDIILRSLNNVKVGDYYIENQPVIGKLTSPALIWVRKQDFEALYEVA